MAEGGEEEGGLVVGWDFEGLGEGGVEDRGAFIRYLDEFFDPAEDGGQGRLFGEALGDEGEQVGAGGGIHQKGEEEAMFGLGDGAAQGFDDVAADFLVQGGGDAGGEGAVLFFEGV